MRKIHSRPVLKWIFTIAGIALSYLLCLYILAAYQAAYDGSINYIASIETDAWVLQDSANNLMRGFSILSRGRMQEVAAHAGVTAVYPLAVFLASIDMGQGFTTVFLTGYDLESGKGRPMKLAAGRMIAGDDEIILDKSIVRKYRFKLGQDLLVNKRPLKLVGISTRSNGVVIQYAFVSLKCAQSFMPLPGLITALLLDIAGDPAPVLRDLGSLFPGLNFFTRAKFIANNIAEIKSGFLPILATVCTISAIVLTVILALILFISVMEKRQDFIIMKILGAPDRMLWQEVLLLSLGTGLTGAAAGLALFFPVSALIEYFIPESATQLLPIHYLGGTGVILLVAVLAGCAASLPIRSIYPLEVFAWKK